MKKSIIRLCAIILSTLALAACGGGGGGSAAPAVPAPPPPTVATTKVFLFGTMSSASAGGSAGIIENIHTDLDLSAALSAGVALTSFVPSGAAAAIPIGDVSTGLIGGVLSLSLLNTTNHISLIANTTSNAGKGIEIGTLTFSLTGGATPPIPTPGTGTTVFQYRTAPLSVKELNGCVVNFTTTYH